MQMFGCPLDACCFAFCVRHAAAFHAVTCFAECHAIMCFPGGHAMRCFAACRFAFCARHAAAFYAVTCFAGCHAIMCFPGCRAIICFAACRFAFHIWRHSITLFRLKQRYSTTLQWLPWTVHRKHVEEPWHDCRQRRRCWGIAQALRLMSISVNSSGTRP